MISSAHPDVDRVMAETGMDSIQAWRHVQQRAQLARQYSADLSAKAAACRDAYAARSTGSIADVIAIEHAAGDDAHVTGLPLEHCQRYVRRNAELAEMKAEAEGGSA